jgi:branched-chain amino acid transport system ATP-binding protein
MTKEAAEQTPEKRNVLLAVKNLAVNYGAIRALHNVDIEVQQGQVVTLLGANGAGKTTTLRAISSLVKPVAGKIIWKNRPIDRRTEAHEIVRMGIAHSPEGRRIFSEMSVYENLEMGAYIRSRRTNEDRQAVEEDYDYVYKLFPRLKERHKQSAGTLSGGEQQMLAIARALMQRPQLLMLDEPSLGIAPVLVEAIFAALKEINKKGTTLLIVEQNAAAALNVADFAYVLETGNTTLSGPAKDLARDPKVISAYLG